MLAHSVKPVRAVAAGPLPPVVDSRSIAVAPAKHIHPHTFVNQDGAGTVFPPANGRWRIVFFGYTNCPDVCPMTLHKVVQVFDRLGPQAAGLDVFSSASIASATRCRR